MKRTLTILHFAFVSFLMNSHHQARTQGFNIITPTHHCCSQHHRRHKTIITSYQCSSSPFTSASLFSSKRAETNPLRPLQSSKTSTSSCSSSSSSSKSNNLQYAEKGPSQTQQKHHHQNQQNNPKRNNFETKNDNDKSKKNTGTAVSNKIDQATFRWLYWLYRQCRHNNNDNNNKNNNTNANHDHDSVSLFYVEAKILRQFLPAAQIWKSHQSVLGAERATEFVETYCLEYLKGNPHIQIQPPISSSSTSGSSSSSSGRRNTYFDKLLRTGWEAWLQLPEDGGGEKTSFNNVRGRNDNAMNATRMLDRLRALPSSKERYFFANKNPDHPRHPDNITIRAKILQQYLDQHEQELQAIKIKVVTTTSNDCTSSAPQQQQQQQQQQKQHLQSELSLLLRAAMDVHSKDYTNMEETLLAMQRTVSLLDRTFTTTTTTTTTTSSSNNNNNNNTTIVHDMIDTLERELVLTLSEQVQLLVLLHSSDWCASVAFPFWKFLYHSLIRALVHTNQLERARSALDVMQEILQNYYSPATASTNSHHDNSSNSRQQYGAPVNLDSIVAAEGEGKELLQLLKRNKEYQWLQWLSHLVDRTPVGKLSESALNMAIPAISTYARRRTNRDAKQAESLLQRYVQEFQAGNEHAILSISLFNRVCDAWAKLGKPERAQRILNQMVQLRQQYPDNTSLKADVITLSTLIAAWANSHDPLAAKRAEMILHRMEADDLNPTTITYNTVLRALIYSPDVNKAMRAEDTIERMEERYQAGHDVCRPSIRTYQSLIAAWSRTDLAGTPQKAERVLELLDRKATEEGRVDLEPNTYCFAAAIHAWAYSLEEQKARRAYNLLTHLRDRFELEGKKHCEPNVVVYTSVINACACPALESEKQEAFEIAQRTLSELDCNRKYGQPNFLTYAAFLRVCATNLEPGPKRDEIVKPLFLRCCEEGQVADVVLDKLKLAVSDGLYQELAGIHQSEDGSWKLPKGWTKRLQGDASQRRSRKKSTHGKLVVKPEAARLQKVRVMSGSTGRFSKNNDDDSISF